MSIKNPYKFVSRILIITLLVAGVYVYMPREEALVELPQPLKTITLEVNPGDTLWSLAQEINADNPRETIHLIKNLNGLKSDLIHPGQLLEVPGNINLQVYNN